MADAGDPQELLRSRGYVRLLVLAGVIGVPVTVAAYGFLELVTLLQEALYEDLPDALGFDDAPVWWPLPPLVLAGFLCALAIQRLPGTGGHHPIAGFHPSGPVAPVELPGIVLAALASLAGGAVLGPEAPLIALGGGLGVLALHLAQRDAPDRAKALVAAAGSFAAISSLFGSPLIGAFLLLEAAGLAGPMVGIVLVPGLLAAGIGSLVFLGLNDLTGLGTFSVEIGNLPQFDALTVPMFGWAIVLGGLAPFLAFAIRRAGRALQARIEPRMVVALPLAGAAIAAIAIAFSEATGKDASFVLFSGQEALEPLVSGAPGWSVAALLALVAGKALAYAIALSGFRGGPVFPAVLIGAAAGIAASHLPGLELVPGLGMGIAAMSTVMLGLPLSSTLLVALLLGDDGVEVMPVVIVAVVVAYVVDARLAPATSPVPGEAQPPAG